MLKKVAIESPYKGDVERNIEFCQNICKFAVQNGYNPFAMHLFYPQFLDDKITQERNLGIQCGLGWTDHANEVWFCLREEDKISQGMLRAIERNTELEKSEKFRKLRYLLFTQEGMLIGTIIGGIKFLKSAKLQETDLYYSTIGRLESCPCPGLVAKTDCNTLWIRPPK